MSQSRALAAILSAGIAVTAVGVMPGCGPDPESEKMRRQLAEQQKQIEELKAAKTIAEQQKQIEELKAKQHTTNYTPRSESFEERVRKAVKDVQISFRKSLTNDYKVMILKNIHPFSIDFQVKCYTLGGSSKTIALSIPAADSREVGFVQGWEGNWMSGERCEAYYNGELIWHHTVK